MTNIHIIPIIILLVLILLVVLVASIIVSQVMAWKSEKEDTLYIVAADGEVRKHKDEKEIIEKIKEIAKKDFEEGQADTYKRHCSHPTLSRVG